MTLEHLTYTNIGYETESGDYLYVELTAEQALDLYENAIVPDSRGRHHGPRLADRQRHAAEHGLRRDHRLSAQPICTRQRAKRPTPMSTTPR